MNPQTRQALLDSIEKWHKNESVNSLREAVVVGSNISLCRVHDWCEGCPVYESTGAYGCDDTPYYDAYMTAHRGNISAFKEYAQRERVFLESLLPKEIEP